MIQIWGVLILVTTLLGAGTWLVHSLKETGREECRAEHAEAARMAELRSRERVDKAAVSFEAKRRTTAARERTVIQEVVRLVERPAYRASCFDDVGLHILADDISQHGVASKPQRILSPASGPAKN